MSCCGPIPNEKTTPETCRVFAAKANLTRNRLDGAPGSLPAVIVEHEGKRYHAVEATFSSATLRRDTAQRPQIWAEAPWPPVSMLRAGSRAAADETRLRLAVRSAPGGVYVEDVARRARVDIFDLEISGPVVFKQATDPRATPSVWLEVNALPLRNRTK